jgi:hypothetical protein
VSYSYEVRRVSGAERASVAAELVDGRLSIKSDVPHLKVEWRVTAWPGRREEERTAAGMESRRPKEGS